MCMCMCVSAYVCVCVCVCVCERERERERNRGGEGEWEGVRLESVRFVIFYRMLHWSLNTNIKPNVSEMKSKPNA